MTHRLGKSLAGRRVPHAGNSGFGAGGDGPSIRAEARVEHRTFVPEGLVHRLARRRIPKLRCVVRRGGDQPTVVRAELRNPANATMAQRTENYFAFWHRPDVDRAIMTSG